MSQTRWTMAWNSASAARRAGGRTVLGELPPFPDSAHRYGFAIRYSWPAKKRRNVKLPLHAVARDLEVQFAHARQDHLPGFFIRADDERRILAQQPGYNFIHAIAVR